MYSYFLYLLKKNVDTFLIDQLGRKSFPLITQDDRSGDSSGQEVSSPGTYIDTTKYAVNDIFFSTEIDEFWVLGVDLSPPFDRLTVQERQLIKWRYVDKKRSSEIAIKITEHPNTVREHLSKLRDKLKDILKSDGMEDYLMVSGLEEDED